MTACRRHAAVLASLVVGLAAIAIGQEAPASLKGVVFDPTNRLLPEAALTLTSPVDPSFKRVHTTNRTGLCAFENLTVEAEFVPGR